MSSVKVTIIGAGSVVFSLGLVKDLCLTEGLKGSMVHFMDINEERLDVVYRLAQRYAEDLGSDLKFARTLDRAESLQDADFVINTATVTHNEYFAKRRRELAAQYGYFYGHTGMPEYHNLQLMLDVAKDVEVIAPEAWILQAGNPVFEGTTLMGRETDVKVCGLCHGHYGYRGVARTIGLDPDKVTWQAPGLNHNIWLTHFYYEGQDAYPILDQWIDDNIEQYWVDHKDTGVSAQWSPAAIHQYKLYGLFPIGDTPRTGGWWYHTDLETRAGLMLDATAIDNQLVAIWSLPRNSKPAALAEVEPRVVALEQAAAAMVTAPGLDSTPLPDLPPIPPLPGTALPDTAPGPAKAARPEADQA